jgi:hypothetical protein
MNLIRHAIDGAVAAAMAEHPKYFTDKGHEHARVVIVRKIMAALRGEGGDKSDDAPAPAAHPSAPIAAEPHSREAIAYLALRHAAGAVPPFRMGDGKFSIPPEAQSEDALAFADAGPASAWPLITDRQQIGAWTEFFRETLPGVPRRPITVTEGDATGIRVPWLWPPAKTGKVYEPADEDVG